MRAAPAALVASVVLLTGCARPVEPERTQGGPPPCSMRAGDRFGSAVLVAQAVPSATLLPCIKTLPAGWSTQSLQARNGRAYFGLDSDRDGVGAVDVTLTRTCDVRDATEVPSERTIVPTPADASTGSPIDINTASAAELDELPGIGPALAERIVALRSERGPFRSVDELELVEGISERTVEQLRPLVTLGE